MSVGLSFENTRYGDDFESVMDVPDSWGFAPEWLDNHDIWFKAYDTSLCENERDRNMNARGVGFSCVVNLRDHLSGSAYDIRLNEFPARDRSQAEAKFALLAAEYMKAKPYCVPEP